MFPFVLCFEGCPLFVLLCFVYLFIGLILFGCLFKIADKGVFVCLLVFISFFIILFVCLTPVALDKGQDHSD